MVLPTLLLTLPITGRGVVTIPGDTRHRAYGLPAEPEPWTAEETMKTTRTAFRLAARPVLAAALLLMAPLVAMQFIDDVAWTRLDFVVMGALVFGTGVLFELAVRKSDDTVYRAAAGVGLAAGFLLVWTNLAVGVIGSPGHAANLVYVGVIAVGIGGAIGAGLEPRGMARALAATAAAQVLVAAIAILARSGAPGSPPLEIVAINGVFAGLWLVSAWLFRTAAREQTPAAAAPAG